MRSTMTTCRDLGLKLSIFSSMQDAFHAGHHAAMSLYDHPPGRTAYATHGM